jgi:hypothetical protein
VLRFGPPCCAIADVASCVWIGQNLSVSIYKLKFTVFAYKLQKERFGGARWTGTHCIGYGEVGRMAKRIQVLEEIDINRLTAALIVPRLADVYLGLLQNCDNRIEEKLM